MSLRLSPLTSPLLLAALLGGACSGSQPAPTTDPGGSAGGEPAVSLSETVRGAMDLAADPCQDFYRYACGGWLDSVEIPGDKSSWSRSFDVIWEKNRDAMRQILEVDVTAANVDAGHKQLVDFYNTCLDTDTLNARGAEPLKPMIDRINAVGDLAGLMAVAAELHMLDVDVLFSSYVGADYKEPEMNIFAVYQGGMGLPDRDYYLSEDPNLAGLRQAYQAHVARMMGLMGADEATAASQAEQILAFETRLAEVSMPLTELRDPVKRYHMMTVEELKALTPNLPWDAYLKTSGAPAFERLNVATPDFLVGLDALLASSDLATVKTYLSWQTLHANAVLLGAEIDQANFEFYGQMLRGQKEQADRWKRCTTGAGFALGDTMSRLFVEREFAGESKDISVAMIKGIEDAFAAALPNTAWMDDETRARALEKMEAISNKIGYPDSWRDYSGVEIVAGKHFENTQATRMFESKRVLAKVGQPIDGTEWFMPAFLVNAYYNPSENEIVFPAGILQAPFFSKDYPAAMNFGGVGMVMGHELTHGFDDGGRQFDGAGMMVEWWAPEVSARFDAAAQCVADQYSGFEVREGLNVNGQLTLGENIADLGGLKESYRAWQAYVAQHGAGEKVEGLTDDQLYFVAFAQSWCTKSTPEMEEVLVRTDSHSPAQFRINGPVSNFPTFGEAFSCEVGSPMRPAEICEVW